MSNLFKSVSIFLIGVIVAIAAGDYLHNRLVINGIRHSLGQCEKSWGMQCSVVALPTSLIHALDHLNPNNDQPAPPSSTPTDPEAMSL